MINLKIRNTGTRKSRSVTRIMSNISLLAGFVSLSACVSLLPDPEPADLVYRIDNNVNFVEAGANAPSLRIDRPTVAIALRGRDIIISQADRSLSVASGAMWADDIPTLVQRSLFDTLSGASDVIGVLPNSGARPQYRMSVNVLNFEALFDQGEGNAPLAVVAYSTVLSDASSRKLLGTFSTKKTVRATEGRVSSIVRAKSQANAQAMDEIKNWVSTKIGSAKYAVVN